MHSYLVSTNFFKSFSTKTLGFHPLINLSSKKASPKLIPTPIAVPIPPVNAMSNTKPAPVKKLHLTAFEGNLSTQVLAVTAS